MKLKDLTIAVAPVVFLISLIVIAVRPQSSLVQIEEKPREYSDSIKVIRVEKKAAAIENEQNTPQDIDLEKVAAK